MLVNTVREKKRPFSLRKFSDETASLPRQARDSSKKTNHDWGACACVCVCVCVCCYAKQGKILKLWTNGRVNPTPHRVVDIVRSYRALRY